MIQLAFILTLLFSLPSITSAQDITSGLIGHWKFDEGSGTTATDSSGNNNTGTLTNGPIWTIGKIGNAVSLDGTNDYIVAAATGNLANLSSVTVSAWINPKVSGSGAIFSKGYGNPNSMIDGWNLNTENGSGSPNTISFVAEFNGSDLMVLSADNSIQLNQWQHVVAVWDGSTTAVNVKLYVNGVLSAHDYDSNGSGSRTNDTTRAPRIGLNSNGGNAFNGQMDDVRIYNRMLSASEVQTIYSIGSGTPSSDTTAPTVSITAPASGSTVSGSLVMVSANASDNVGVVGVQFKLDGTNLGAEDTMSPYSITWNTNMAPNGSHTLTAVARDAAGNTTISSEVTITVSNVTSDTQAPSTPSGLSASTISSSQINLSWTASTDNVGVTGYRVERCQGSACTNFAQIAISPGTSYQDSGLQSNTTYCYRVQATDVVGNLSGYSSIASATTQTAGTSQLAQLAASMSPGTWAQLSTNGFGLPLLDAGSGQHILQFATKGTWDPIAKRFLYYGQGHYANGKFITYDDATNTWSVEPKPYWDCSPSCSIGHGYEHNTLDPTTGDFYYRLYYSRTIYKYSRSTASWSALPNVPTSVLPNIQVAGAIEYFPEMGGLVFVDSNGVAFFKSSTNQWSSLSGSLAMAPYDNFAKYNPVAGVVVFGGGNGDTNIYKLTSAGVITKLSNAPIGLGVTDAVFTVDPISGKYLVFQHGDLGGRFYEYDVVTNTWTLQSGGASSLWTNTNSGNEAIAAPITTYGVVMFITWKYDQSKVVLYKHSASAPPLPDTTPPSTPTNLTATTISSSQINLSWTASTDNVGVSGYRVEHCQGSTCTSFSQIATPPGTNYQDSSLQSNTTYRYQVRAADAVGNLSGYSSIASAMTQSAPAFDFSVSSGGNVSVTQGSSVNNTITASLVSGTAQSVSFSASGLPTGATASFSPASCNPTCTSILTITTLTTTPTGTYTITITGTGGSLTRSTTYSITVSAPSGGSDFQTRCSQPGVVRCYGFDDLVDLTTAHPRTLTNPTDSTNSRMYNPSGGTAPCTGGQCWALDANTRVSGASSLRFEIPSNTGADTSGSFRLNFADDFSQQFGAGEEFYVQYRERFSPEMLRAFQGANGWKQSIVGMGDRVGQAITYSCTAEEMVFQQDTRYMGPGFYHGCGFWETMAFWDGTQIRMQHQGPPNCYYPNDPLGGCFRYVANQWMTFKMHIKIGGWGTHPGNRVRVWAAREGQSSVMIYDSQISHPNGFPIHQTDSTSKYGKIWLLPYNTNKSSAEVHPTAYIWYDDLIISRNDIADPGTTTPPPTTLLGDLNNDRTVNNFDWNIMVSVWFTNDPTADLNKDGIVNTADYYYIYANWGKSI